MLKNKIALLIVIGFVFIFKVNAIYIPGTTDSWAPLQKCIFDVDYSYIIGKFKGEIDGENVEFTFTKKLIKKIGLQEVYECFLRDNSQQAEYLLLSVNSPKGLKSTILFNPRVKYYNDGNGEVLEGDFLLYRFLDRNTLRLYIMDKTAGFEVGPVYDLYRVE